jgi:hypothetical protein
VRGSGQSKLLINVFLSIWLIETPLESPQSIADFCQQYGIRIDGTVHLDDCGEHTVHEEADLVDGRGPV